MSIHRLKRIAELKHLSEYTVEKLVTDFSLYHRAIISTKDVLIKNDGTEDYISVSNDVQRLNELLNNGKRIMLPCADCGQQQPFQSSKWRNPQQSEEITNVSCDSLMDGIQKTRRTNVFEIKAPYYRIGSDMLNKWDSGDKEKAKKKDAWNKYIEKCITECRGTILHLASEIRKDYFCTYQRHHVFVDFRIYDPIEQDDYNEYVELFSSKNIEDQKALEAFNSLRDCLIIQKVGQYPSLADMKLFDIGKYRRILGRELFRFCKSHWIIC